MCVRFVSVCVCVCVSCSVFVCVSQCVFGPVSVCVYKYQILEKKGDASYHIRSSKNRTSTGFYIWESGVVRDSSVDVAASG